ncbi:MAG TPA: glycoside hydrolase family 5 protein, partial [Melioribacteraceae bacterium]|nr:glycoside hydrolase family 5 protein [Melioribacteraceae bacterium]
MQNIFLALLFFIVPLTTFSQNSKFYSSLGKDITDASGNPILIKGINLGNWMVPEGYFIKFKEINSSSRIYTFFNILLGETEAKKFWKQYYSLYITKDDIKLIKQLG